MNLDDIESVMEALYRHRAPNLPASALAALFDRLIWCLDDNGETLLRVREGWLQSSDRDKVEIALAMEETFPFQSASEMERVLTAIAVRWPDLSARCAELRARRPAID